MNKSAPGQPTASPHTDQFGLEHALVLETARVTEAAALAASRLVGMGDKNGVDGAGTEAMRSVLNSLDIRGTVVIGEGEMDEAPMLYIGEKLGNGKYEVDIAVDPVEGTVVTAKGLPNGLAVIAISEKGGLMHAPDCYMEKLVVPPPAAGRVNLDWPVEANLAAIAQSLDRSVQDLLVVILDRERHTDLIRRVRTAGARVKLIGDGDVVASLAVGVRGTGVHALMGSGGAPEGVLSAAPSSASARRSRGASWRRMTPCAPASRRWAWTSTASTAPPTSRRAVRWRSPRPASRTANCSTACAASVAGHARTRS